jgi:condensin complex subunit 2
VKIWTSRVDSVATETGKLLSGLAGGGGSGAGEGEDGEGGEDEGAEGEDRPAKRKTHRSEATLAKSFQALQAKKIDQEFSVDPLFKKTSADFDEGGAMGLLMNHLGVDGRGRVVFDAGDAVVGGAEEEEEDDDVEDLLEEGEKRVRWAEGEGEVPLEKLRRESSSIVWYASTRNKSEDV